MELKEKAILIIKKLVREGYTAYFAGGYVRDLILEQAATVHPFFLHPSSDIDIATNAPPEKILDLFNHTIPVGLSFGVVIVLIEGHPFEVSTFRKDINYVNGRKPESIELSTPEEDASRRDFTINGLFFDPLENRIYDYVKGQEDIQKGIIRTIGNPQDRFFEDRLRMIRAVRFASRFNFIIDKETEEAIIENRELLFPAVAIERIVQELTKMAEAKNFQKSILSLHKYGLLQVIFPILKGSHQKDIEKETSSFSRFPKNTPLIIYLCQLFKNQTKKDVEELCYVLKLSKKESETALFYHANKKNLCSPNEQPVVELVHFYANPESDLLIQIEAAHLKEEQVTEFLTEHEKNKLFYSDQIKRIRNKTPLITGKLLKELGIQAGKKMGLLLKMAEELSIIHHVKDEKELLELLRKTDCWDSQNVY